MSTMSRLAVPLLLTLAAPTCARPTPATERVSDGARPDGLASEGARAPDIDAVAHDGQHISLAALRGRVVVVYFYPRDDTSGCTKEACEFRDAWSRFKEAGAVVVGVSTDDNQSHTAFADKYHLPFPLVPDEHATIAKAYGVPVHVGFAKRVTFVIDRDGRIAKVFPAVNPVGHAGEILAAIASLPPPASSPAPAPTRPPASN